MTSTSASAPPRRGFAKLGPAFITAALVFGPGSITTASSMGADFAYDLVWVPVIATVLMLCFVDLCVRIGLSTDSGPIGTISQRFTRVAGVLVGLGAFAVTASFQAGNSAGTGAAMSVLFGGNSTLFAILFTLVALGFVWLPSFYRQLERVMVVIILVLVVIFVLTMVVARPDVGQVVAGLVPSFPSGSSALIVGAAATTFSVVGALYQIQLVREKGWTAADYRIARKDAVTGTLILGGLSFVIMVAAAAVLNPRGASVQSPADMAAILEPAIGGWASTLFALGLWAAAFSSLIGNSTIGGGMLAGALNLEEGGLSSSRVKVCISAVILLGGIVATIFGGLPVQLIITAQAVTIFVVPLIGVLLVWLGRVPERGALKLPVAQFVLAVAGVLFLILLAINYLRNLL